MTSIMIDHKEIRIDQLLSEIESEMVRIEALLRATNATRAELQRKAAA